MTQDIIVSHENGHLKNSLRALDRLQTRVGDSDKKRKVEVKAATFLAVLSNYLNGTFVWKDGPKEGDKWSTIFEALAADMPEVKVQQMGHRALMDHVDETAPRLKSGFYAARQVLEKWFGHTIYSVPQHEEASVHTVLTIDPDFRLEGGKTAAEMQTMRDVKLAEGQVKASSARLATALPPHKVKGRLDHIFKDALQALKDRSPHFPEITNDTE